MKIYNCDVCGHQIYFENTLCLNCGSQLGYLPLLDNMISLAPESQELNIKNARIIIKRMYATGWSPRMIPAIFVFPAASMK